MTQTGSDDCKNRTQAYSTDADYVRHGDCTGAGSGSHKSEYGGINGAWSKEGLMIILITILHQEERVVISNLVSFLS